MPLAPIIRQWMSSLSTRAMGLFFLPLHPSTSPCWVGRFCPLRHSLTWKEMWAQVLLISLGVAHRAVPCWPSPTVRDLMPLRV